MTRSRLNDLAEPKIARAYLDGFAAGVIFARAAPRAWVGDQDTFDKILREYSSASIAALWEPDDEHK